MSWQHHEKGAAPAKHALDADLAPLELGQLFCQGETESRAADAFLRPTDRGIDLLEGTKQARQLVRADPDPRIRYLDADHLRPVGCRLQGHRSTGRRKLDRIRQIGVHDLLERRNIADQMCALSLDRDGQLQLLGVDIRTQRAGNQRDQCRQIDVSGLELELPCFDAGEVEDIADHLQKISPAGQDMAEKLPLLVRDPDRPGRNA